MPGVYCLSGWDSSWMSGDAARLPWLAEGARTADAGDVGASEAICLPSASDARYVGVDDTPGVADTLGSGAGIEPMLGMVERRRW